MAQRKASGLIKLERQRRSTLLKKSNHTFGRRYLPSENSSSRSNNSNNISDEQKLKGAKMMLQSLEKQKEQITDCINRLNKVEHELKKIMFTSQMMSTLILDLLDLAQLENRNLRINNQYFNLHDIVEQAFMVINHLSTHKSISLEKKVELDKEVFFKTLFGDERRFLQILINFLSNAIKFSQKGSKVIVAFKLNQFIEIEKKHQHRRSGNANDKKSMLLDTKSTH